MLPFILGMLLFIGVIIGGQTLMTSTVEEKSSRVVEVLLAAVSPFELMAGKLLGQLGDRPAGDGDLRRPGPAGACIRSRCSACSTRC